MSTDDQINLGIVLFTALSAIFTGIAAVAAWRAVQMTRKAAEAAVCIRFAERYESDRMLTALRTLRLGKPKPGGDITTIEMASHWAHELQKKPSERPEWALDLDKARREVSGYFFWLARLYESGMLSKRSVRTVGQVAGINLFYDVCEPLELALNAHYSARHFRLLERIVGRYPFEQEALGRIWPDEYGARR